MWDILYYLIVVVLLAALAVAGAFAFRAYRSGQSPLAGFFGPRPERRLDVVEHSNVDGRRRLVLVRRDDVEHLIMTGGPVDVVIETGIKPPPRGHVAEVVDGPSPPVFSRQARSFGQLSSD